MTPLLCRKSNRVFYSHRRDPLHAYVTCTPLHAARLSPNRRPKAFSLSARPPRHRHHARSAARGTRTSCALFVLEPSARIFGLAPFEEASRRAACACAAVLKVRSGRKRGCGWPCGRAARRWSAHAETKAHTNTARSGALRLVTSSSHCCTVAVCGDHTCMIMQASSTPRAQLRSILELKGACTLR